MIDEYPEGTAKLVKNAALNGLTKEFKYLFTNPKFKHLVDKDHIKNEAFIDACKRGHLEIVQFLLTSPEINGNVDIHLDKDNGLQMACLSGRLNVVNYLLTSQELKEKADIHAEDDNPFKFAASQSHMEVVRFLITEMNILFTPHIDIYLDKIEGEDIRKMFKLRNLSNELNKTLPMNQEVKRKNKL
jgi:ankyrin repeat protein